MILCGLFCAGKSTLGRALATRMDLPFYDTDQLLEAKLGKSVSEIWQIKGQEGFRDLESALILTLKPEPCVLATGGGTLLYEANRAHLKKLGKTIYLKTSLLVLWERLQKRGLPAYLDPQNPFEHIKRLAQERIPIFEAFCDYTVETTGLTVEACVHNWHHFF